MPRKQPSGAASPNVNGFTHRSQPDCPGGQANRVRPHARRAGGGVHRNRRRSAHRARRRVGGEQAGRAHRGAVRVPGESPRGAAAPLPRVRARLAGGPARRLPAVPRRHRHLRDGARPGRRPQRAPHAAQAVRRRPEGGSVPAAGRTLHVLRRGAGHPRVPDRPHDAGCARRPAPDGPTFQLLCGPCNNRKRDHTDEEFRRRFRELLGASGRGGFEPPRQQIPLDRFEEAARGSEVPQSLQDFRGRKFSPPLRKVAIGCLALGLLSLAGWAGLTWMDSGLPSLEAAREDWTTLGAGVAGYAAASLLLLWRAYAIGRAERER